MKQFTNLRLFLILILALRLSCSPVFSQKKEVKNEQKEQIEQNDRPQRGQRGGGLGGLNLSKMSWEFRLVFSGQFL